MKIVIAKLAGNPDYVTYFPLQADWIFNASLSIFVASCNVRKKYGSFLIYELSKHTIIMNKLCLSLNYTLRVL